MKRSGKNVLDIRTNASPKDCLRIMSMFQIGFWTCFALLRDVAVGGMYLKMHNIHKFCSPFSWIESHVTI